MFAIAKFLFYMETVITKRIDFLLSLGRQTTANLITVFGNNDETVMKQFLPAAFPESLHLSTLAAVTSREAQFLALYSLSCIQQN